MKFMFSAPSSGSQSAGYWSPETQALELSWVSHVKLTPESRSQGT